MRVLVTGGAGYIGSTVVSALLDAGHEPVILDDLSAGRREFIRGLPFYEGDIADRALVRTVLADHPRLTAAVHCAASVVVPESVCDPAAYYRNNVVGSLALAETLAAGGVTDLVFSSSASVYATGDDPGLDEHAPLAPGSPYARTKAMVETILADLAEATGLRTISLRYFNPVGADPLLRTGTPQPAPTHVLGRLIATSRAREPFHLTGVDYPTPDGTGIRDYVHVWDLARAHVAALEHFDRALGGQRHQAINLGTGRGTSVRELIEVFGRVTGEAVDVVEAPRRPGDAIGAFARCERAAQLLDWKAELDLESGIRDSLAWSAKRGSVLGLISASIRGRPPTARPRTGALAALPSLNSATRLPSRRRLAIAPLRCRSLRRPSTDRGSDVVTGAAAVDRIRALAGFIDTHSTAFCTSSSWLDAAARHLAGEPVVITVSEDDGRVVGLAALSTARQHGVWGIALLGGEHNDYGQFHYTDERAGTALASAVARWVTEEHRAWSLLLAQLPPEDPVVADLRARLPRARIEPGAPIPQITGIGTDYVVSRNRRRKANNAAHRLEADGRSGDQLVIRERDQLDRWLPAIIAVRRERDHACGRRSHLDDPAARAFYQETVRSLCEAGSLVVDVLLVDGAVAGYGMVVVEPGVHRVFDGRVADGLDRYRGALVCDLAALARAEQDPAVSTFDWLRGRTDGKFGNHEVQRVDLVATSHAAVDRVGRWDRAARERVKTLLPEAALQRIARR